MSTTASAPGCVGPPEQPASLHEEVNGEVDEAEDTDEIDDPPEPQEDGESPKEGKEAKKNKKKEKKELAPAKILKDKTMGHLEHEELDWIWIGDAEDARDAAALRKHNVKYILNCTPPRNNGGVTNFHERDPYFSYCRLSMGDNATEHLASRLEEAWAFLERVRIREDGGVLVHCQQGVSRSSSMIIAYLMKYYRYYFEDALALVKINRKQACPNEGFTQQLKDLDEMLRRTNGYEKVPPKRSRQVTLGPTQPNIGPARPAAGPSRGPVGRPSGEQAVAATRPAVGPQAGKSPSGPTRGPVGPQRGPPAPAAPAAGPKAEKRKAAGPAAGPVRPEAGPVKPKRAKQDAVDLTAL